MSAFPPDGHEMVGDADRNSGRRSQNNSGDLSRPSLPVHGLQSADFSFSLQKIVFPATCFTEQQLVFVIHPDKNSSNQLLACPVMYFFPAVAFRYPDVSCSSESLSHDADAQIRFWYSGEVERGVRSRVEDEEKGMSDSHLLLLIPEKGSQVRICRKMCLLIQSLSRGTACSGRS